jgi:N-acetylmuramoyl-L-alanine amidase
MRKLPIFALILILGLGISYYFFTIWNSESVLLRYGSKGQKVSDMQARLKDWGYYDGSVDGIYGWRTVRAVRWFQQKHNLRVDGIAGPETLAAIGLPTGGGGAGVTDGDLYLLAMIINGEARGEPYEGQVAVGAVILNRVRHPSFPNTIAGVIYQPGAFTAIIDGQIHAHMEASSFRAARDALNGWDPTGGAIYYYNPARTTNKWIYSRPIVHRIGTHVFAI